MDSDKKAKTARALGVICLVFGPLNLTLAGVLMALDRTAVGRPILVTGLSVLTVGIVIVARGKQKPTPGA